MSIFDVDLADVSINTKHRFGPCDVSTKLTINEFDPHTIEACLFTMHMFNTVKKHINLVNKYSTIKAWILALVTSQSPNHA